MSRVFKETANKILIASITPYFLERDVLWFQNNAAKIEQISKTQVWWKENTIFLEKDQAINLFELLRRLTELGYERVQTLGAKGEFSQRGGILDIFPINGEAAFRLEFTGNKLSEIFPLPLRSDLPGLARGESRAGKGTRGLTSTKKELIKRAPQDLLSNLKPGEFVVHLDHGIGIFRGFAKELGGELSPSVPAPGNEALQELPPPALVPVNSRSAEPRTDRLTHPSISHDKKNEAVWRGEYFVIEYAKADKLYVPLKLENKLSRFIGFETPIVHRLGGTLWYKTKRKVKESAIEMAKQLFELYAHRAASRGFNFPPDDSMQKELEESFEYIETGDQLRAINDVKKDMESEKPMDRLICGDVGFGKTEVALRAAFKAVAAGKQAALLAPTTILAHQHWLNFSKRLKRFPVTIALLSRLESKKQQHDNIKNLKEGKIDIIIGTHRLIQKDVEFKNLGLVIVDEEQRFGVKQKEFFKGLRNLLPERSPARRDEVEGYSEKPFDAPSGLAQGVSYSVDILNLTATPIPRTMHLALTGLRDISQIQTAPPGRLAVKTIIKPYSKKIIKEAIEKEISRGGQVYYLHNRVETIELAKKQIEKLLAVEVSPQGHTRSDLKRPTIAIAHGRMHEKQLVDVMDKFSNREIDILIATTIIENGLDIPNVNTLIVANATRLGLAQSYQLRGRIGRSDKQAFAYFLYNAKNLTDIAQQRLDALKEAEALGSGYQIAFKDLEIRGAGNILGREQSGSINAVGLNLYVQMLNEAVEELKK